jgi:ubiquinone/menaquinone biosynthesis C-methylase UbiE
MNPNKLHFKMMAFSFKLRDLFSPRRNILKEVGIKPGYNVLDYGCGPGSYILPVAELVGKSGKIYALDINPLAARAVQKISSKKRLTNVETITSDCKTGLPSDSIDVVLLYDTFHALSDPNSVLKELHRVLKPGGILSLSDHHMREKEIISKITSSGLFKLSKKGEKVYNFQKS